MRSLIGLVLSVVALGLSRPAEARVQGMEIGEIEGSPVPEFLLRSPSRVYLRKITLGGEPLRMSALPEAMVVVAPANEVVDVVALNAACLIQEFPLLAVKKTTRSIVRLRVDMITVEMARVVVLTEIMTLLGCLKTLASVEGDARGQLVLIVLSVEAIICSATALS